MAKKTKAKEMAAEEQELLDVEISFLEGLLAREERWVDVLKLLGDSYTRRGRIQDGLRVDEQLATLCPEDPVVYYNLACSFSLAEKYEEAFSALDRAVRLGYTDFKWLSKDPDMANLRKHPKFKAFQVKFGSANP